MQRNVPPLSFVERAAMAELDDVVILPMGLVAPERTGFQEVTSLGRSREKASSPDLVRKGFPEPVPPAGDSCWTWASLQLLHRLSLGSELRQMSPGSP